MPGVPAMKRFILFACVYTLLRCGLPTAVAAQDIDPYPNYVVIGAFAHHKNAIHFTDDANKHHFPAQFEMNPNRNLYYVYVLTTADRDYAMTEALRLRTETKYFDTWVFSGPLGEGALTVGGVQARDFNPVTGQNMETIQVNQHAANEVTGRRVSTEINDQPLKSSTRTVAELRGTGTAGEPGVSGTREELTTADNKPSADQRTERSNTDGGLTTEETVDTTSPAREFPKKVSTAPLTPEEVIGKNFYFQLFRADNREWVEGEVDAIDFERSRKMATYAANTPVKVMMPSGKSKQVSFVCQVFGYRKQQIEFDPENPAPDIFLDDKGNLVVPFELVRLQKGDIAIMYNVFFFKDAAVMRPESRYEVNNLLDLLEENPSYKIKIHGHTNGNASGKIIRMDKSENFYSLSNTKQGFGSAKKLSEERALVIKQFLVSSGVTEDRMLVKAWGGKKPIHDKHSVRAIENVRVEIEILSD